jgi:TonB family protein
LVDSRAGEEQPLGQGFGAAALALAAKSVDGCGRPLPPAMRVMRPVRFTFRASPPAITPDPRQPGWILNVTVWRHVASGEQFARFYPERAALFQIGGEAVVQCAVDADGKLVDCQAIAESRHDFDFGKAALGLSPLFQVDRRACRQVSEPIVVYPIVFQPPG